MINLDDVNKTLRDIVASIIGGGYVVTKAKQTDATRPRGPYADVDYLTSIPVGWEQHSEVLINGDDDNVTEKISGMRNVTMTVNFFRDNAITNANIFYTGLVRELTQILMAAGGLGFISRSVIRELSLSLDTKWEERASLDVVFSTVGLDLSTIPVINVVDVSQTVELPTSLTKEAPFNPPAIIDIKLTPDGSAIELIPTPIVPSERFVIMEDTPPNGFPPEERVTDVGEFVWGRASGGVFATVGIGTPSEWEVVEMIINFPGDLFVGGTSYYAVAASEVNLPGSNVLLMLSNLQIGFGWAVMCPDLNISVEGVFVEAPTGQVTFRVDRNTNLVTLTGITDVIDITGWRPEGNVAFIQWENAQTLVPLNNINHIISYRD